MAGLFRLSAIAREEGLPMRHAYRYARLISSACDADAIEFAMDRVIVSKLLIYEYTKYKNNT